MERQIITASRMRLFRSYVVILESISGIISQAEVEANLIVAKLLQLPDHWQAGPNSPNNSGDYMRIRDALSSIKIKTNSTHKTTSNNNPSTRQLFSVEILQKENELNNGYGKEIDELRKEIETAGGRLENEPTIPNFKQFRDILSKLAKRISAEAYYLEKSGGTPQNPRYFEIITTINFEADKLYNLIIQEQKNNMAITAKVIGIKGLVVDLIT